MATINTDSLDKINAQLDGIIVYMDKFSEDLSKLQTTAGETTQALVDKKMEELSASVEGKLLDVRAKVVKTFSEQYKIALQKLEPIKPLMNVSISLDTVVSVVKSIINVITAPYQPIIEFTTEVIPKVIEISNKLQTIASYKPSVDVPNVDVPPLNVNVPPITAKDITG